LTKLLVLKKFTIFCQLVGKIGIVFFLGFRYWYSFICQVTSTGDSKVTISVFKLSLTFSIFD